MTFRADVKRCEWIEERARWRLTVLDLETGTEFFHECQFLFSGAGLLVNPRGFDVPGAESFPGPIIHSARWDNDLDLAGKSVVLFGNGCTAVQIVPNILGKTKHLTQIVRSKHWILPSFDRAIGPVAQWMLRYVPGANFVLRPVVYLFTESEAKPFSMTESGRRFRERWQKVSETYIRETAPAKYHDLLIPDFEIGCKRRIFDSGYVESLHSENLMLTDDKVVQILSDGVRTERGFVEANVIGGKTATEHWDEFGGPEAYNTTALSGFPNFFMMYGPNSGTGHTSTIINIENAINFALRAIKPVIDGQASIVNVKRGAEEWYSDRVQQKSRATVWYSGCVSWYFKTTKNGQKWNSMINPLSQVQFWFQSLFPTWGHWEYSCHGHLMSRNLIGPKQQGFARGCNGSSPEAVAESFSGASCAQPPRALPSEAYIDRILQSGPQDLLLCHEPFVVKVSNAYFTRVHPLHPFLDRQQFQDQVSSPGLNQLLIDNPAFSALYHAVMALGSQYCQEGSFEPGVGKAWELFQVSLGHMADLIAPRESFESLQIISDDDIGCMVPATPESHFGEFNWFLSTIRFGRLLTIAYQSLFSLSASLRSVESYLAAIHHVRNLLEQWRLSIPVEYQPGGSTRFGNVFDPNETLVALQTHFSYYHLVIGLERLTLHLDKEEGPRKQDSMLRLMKSAKSIVELTRFIDLEPHVPLL
ncbi:hypothetical protein LRP88_02164 [Fusarium phalaenopsidis]